MNGSFLNSPYSVPIVIVSIVVGLPIIMSTIKSIFKMRYEGRGKDREQEAAYRAEIGELRRRVENLETIVLELERKGSRI